MSLFPEYDFTPTVNDLGVIVAYIGPRRITFEMDLEDSLAWCVRLRDASGTLVMGSRSLTPAESVRAVARWVRQQHDR